MNTDQIKEHISIKGRKIVNVFPGPEPFAVVVCTVPKKTDVQFELFSREEIGEQLCEEGVDKFKSRVLDTNFTRE